MAALPAQAFSSPARWSGEHWVGTWAASPQIQMPGTAPIAFAAQTTLRQIVHTSIGGSEVRVCLSNEIGSQPLVVGAARIALRSTGAGVVAGSDRPLTFGGRASITIAPGAPALSDPVRLDVPALSDLAISLHLPEAVTATTFHGVALQTAYVAPAGADHTAAAVLPAGTTLQSWAFLTGVNVAARPRAAAIVALGDSITDGVQSTADANRRWTDILAQRLQARRGADDLAVLNEGINGDRLLSEGSFAPNVSKRFDRDVVARAGVRYVAVLVGINDIGHSALGDGPVLTAADLVAGYRQLIARAHEKGLVVYGATLTPMGGSRYDVADAEELRAAVNEWIRNGGEFDGVIDFDRVTRDPAQPRRLLPLYDSADHLHPNDAGYRAMGEAVPLQLFEARQGDYRETDRSGAVRSPRRVAPVGREK
jgi:lysophospholipase L1-like esterase